MLKRLKLRFLKKGTVIVHLSQEGCMGEIHEFKYAGEIVGSFFKEKKTSCFVDGIRKVVTDDLLFYNVRNFDTNEIEQVPSWYLIKLNDNCYQYLN